MGYFSTFFMGLFPYIAVTVFVVGSLLRYGREQYTWKAGSSQLLENKRLPLASNLFHIGVLGVLFGHFFGLLMPPQVWHMLGVSYEMKQLMAVAGGGGAGALCFIGLTILVHRRFTDPRVRAASTTMDLVILSMLYAQLILGMISIYFSLQHMDGSSMVKFMAWAQGLITFHPFSAVGALEGVNWIFKAHITLGFATMLLFPFSRLVHIFSVPVRYVKRSFQIVRE